MDLEKLFKLLQAKNTDDRILGVRIIKENKDLTYDEKKNIIHEYNRRKLLGELFTVRVDDLIDFLNKTLNSN